MTQVKNFQFAGGRLCLDFANTVDNRRSPQAVDQIDIYEDVIEWTQQAGILSASDAQQIVRASANNQMSADSALQHAVTLREAIYQIFSAVAAKGQPPLVVLERLNRTVRDAGGSRILVAGKERFNWKWMTPPGHLEWILWPVALDAAELLTSDDVSRVRECGSETCGWLFIDRSKSHNRRWCEMKSCGNRYKARRHYERVKAE